MWRVVALGLGLALPAVAEAPETSLFPRARPTVVAQQPVIATSDTQAIEAPAEALDAAAQAALDAVGAAETEAVAEEAATLASGALNASLFRGRNWAVLRTIRRLRWLNQRIGGLCWVVCSRQGPGRISSRLRPLPRVAMGSAATRR
jgi:hypothetical protein